MSIGTRVMLAVLVLGAILSVILTRDGLEAWRSTQAATRAHELNAVSDDLVTAAGALALERGLLNGALADPAGVNQALRPRIEAARSRANDAIGRVLKAVAAETPTDAVNARLASLAEARRAVDRLRSEADGIWDGKRPLPAPPPWFAATTAQIDAVVTLRRQLDGQANAESRVAGLMVIRDRLAEMSEFAGRERGLINGMLAQGGKANPALLMRLGENAARIDGAWALIGMRLGVASPALREAIAAAEKGWFESFAPVRRQVLEAALQGAPPAMAAPDWFARSTAAIDTLLAAQKQAGIDVDDALSAQIARADTGLAWAAVLLALGVALIVVMAWQMRVAVSRPLSAAIAVVDRLAAGDVLVDVPLRPGRDEISRLLRATAHFRDTAQRGETLLHEQEVLRAQAVAARKEAILGLGDTIEQVNNEAMRVVRRGTVELMGLASQLERSAATIADDCNLAAGEAKNSERGTDSVASSTQELTASIDEIAGQMARATTATRSAVGQTQSAQAVFAALSSSVAEIGEVAELIHEVAGRTNLLALNAAVEAARAGEAGRGFAVVAGEVKALAQETAGSTEKITQRISLIEQTTGRAIAMMASIAASVDELNNVSTSIAAAIEQQSTSTATIAQSVGQARQSVSQVSHRMDGVARQTADCAEAAVRMSTIGRSVEEEMDRAQGQILSTMRARVAELDRRQSERIPVDMPGTLHPHGTLESATVSLSGRILDLSRGGAKFLASPDAVVPTKGKLYLSADRLPRTEVRLVGRKENTLHLAFVLHNEREQQRIVASVNEARAA
jgi:methyl-accepting chemotaxis protein